jgi:hypothetical protein
LTTTFRAPNLRREPAKTLLVFIGGRSEGELIAEVVGHPLFQADGCLEVHTSWTGKHAQCFAQLILGQALHSDEETATITFAAGPAFYVARDLFPASEVEIADAKVCPIGKVDRLAQGGQKLLLNVVEDARHPFCYSEDCVSKVIVVGR